MSTVSPFSAEETTATSGALIRPHLFDRRKMALAVATPADLDKSKGDAS